MTGFVVKEVAPTSYARSMAKTSSRLVEHHDGKMGDARVAADRIDEGEAVHPRHLEVAHHQVEAGIALQDRERLLAVGRGHDLAAGMVELRRRELEQDRVVVDNQKTRRRFE